VTKSKRSCTFSHCRQTISITYGGASALRCPCLPPKRAPGHRRHAQPDAQSLCYSNAFLFTVHVCHFHAVHLCYYHAHPHAVRLCYYCVIPHAVRFCCFNTVSSHTPRLLLRRLPYPASAAATPSRTLSQTPGCESIRLSYRFTVPHTNAVIDIRSVLPPALVTASPLPQSFAVSFSQGFAPAPLSAVTLSDGLPLSALRLWLDRCLSVQRLRRACSRPLVMCRLCEVCVYCFWTAQGAIDAINLRPDGDYRCCGCAS